MTNQINGSLVIQEKKIAIIVARFNSAITEKLLEGAIDCFERHGLKSNLIDIIRVPGAFEIPLACKKCAVVNKYDAMVALGCVIRGDTPHFDYVASEVTKGVASVSLEHTIPISFGVLTTDNVDQAMNRAGIKNGNKGFEAAMTTIEMLDVMSKIK
jgi:6,7-dimethyl-8-ribityllumazine synthase